MPKNQIKNIMYLIVKKPKAKLHTFTFPAFFIYVLKYTV
jgi:hypothetical protein